MESKGPLLCCYLVGKDCLDVGGMTNAKKKKKKGGKLKVPLKMPPFTKGSFSSEFSWKRVHSRNLAMLNCRLRKNGKKARFPDERRG